MHAEIQVGRAVQTSAPTTGTCKSDRSVLRRRARHETCFMLSNEVNAMLLVGLKLPLAHASTTLPLQLYLVL